MRPPTPSTVLPLLRRRLPVPLTAGVLAAAALLPGLGYAAHPLPTLLAALLGLAAYAGAGYLVLGRVFPAVSYRTRLCLAPGVGIPLVVLLQFICGLQAADALRWVELVVLVAGLAGVVLAARDLRRAPPVEGSTPAVTLVVLLVLSLLFAVPAGREMSRRPDGSVTVQYLDMATQTAVVAALTRLPPPHPFSAVGVLHYHYLAALPAARLSAWLDLTAADALFRTWRPVLTLGFLLALAALPGLLGGGRRAVTLSWLGPALACGLPSLYLYGRNLMELSRAAQGQSAGMALPAYGWDFCGDFLMGVGGPGLCLLLPVLTGLACLSSPRRPAEAALLWGLLAGVTVGFNGVGFLVAAGGFLAVVAGEERLRASWPLRLLTGLSLLGAGWWLLQALGAGEAALVRSPVPDLNARYLAQTLAALCLVLHLKLLLVPLGLRAARARPGVRFLAGVAGTALLLVLFDTLGRAPAKYLREAVALAVTLLAVAGAAELAGAGPGAAGRRWLHQGGRLLAAAGGAALGKAVLPQVGMHPLPAVVLGGALGLGLAALGSGRARLRLPTGAGARRVALAGALLLAAVGGAINTQFLWRAVEYGEQGRRPAHFSVAPEVAVSLEALRRDTPRAAVLACALPPRPQDWGWRAEPDTQVQYLATVWSALSERRVASDEAFGAYVNLGQPADLAAAAALGRALREAPAPEARRVLAGYGVTHLVLTPGQSLPWAPLPSWLRPRALPGSLRVWEVTPAPAGGE